MKKRAFYLLLRYRKFLLIGLAFCLWMVFFDNRSMIVQHNLNRQIATLESEYSQYEQKLSEVKTEYEAMLQNPEKYAREKFYMHRPTEEVFIFRKQ